MSVGAHVAVLSPASRRRARSRPKAKPVVERPLIGVLAFTALALYGVVRWATLLTPAPTGRLLGLLAIAVLVAGGGPAITARRPVIAVLGAIVALLGVVALAGVPLAWVVHLRVAVSADAIEHGLSALPGALVPYVGPDDWVRVVIVLGAGVLLFGAGLMLAFAPRALGDLRRGAAALPLVALAVVPSALTRPQLPYLQGLLLFALLIAFMWGERLRGPGLAGTIAVACLAGAGAMLAAPALGHHRPWVNYEALAGSVSATHVDTFDWTQHYGPLSWPRSGHTVLEVKAATPDYWKAENLDVFNGTGWTEGAGTMGAQIPNPAPAAVARWSQTLTVTIRGLDTTDVIAAGYAAEPFVSEGALPGVSPGTWTTVGALGLGDTYQVQTYSPRPSPAELARAGNGYPDEALADYRSIELPPTALTIGAQPEVVFPPFHSPLGAQSVIGTYGASGTVVVEDSPYAGAYALAQRLARHAATQYAFVRSVERYLSHGFTYDQNVPAYTYPLETFLFQDKRGYCQQFSGAMALLLRMGGIPARVAAGFTTGTYDAATHEWVVSDRDAHAWVEAWFPYYGWVRFDPTPAAAPARAGTGIPAVLAAAPRSANARVAAKSGPAPVAPPPRGPAHARSGSTVSPLVIALVLLIAAAMLTLRRRRRGRQDSGEPIAELERALARCGRPIAPGTTLAQLEHRFRSSPDAAGYVHALRLARYGGSAVAPPSAGRRALRAQLADGLGPSGRLRAIWALPPRTRRRP